MDCSNLLTGEAYCVNGANQPPSATQFAAGSVARRGLEARETGGLPIGWPYPIWDGLRGLAIASQF
jgi:hypothetical protein